MNKKEYIYALSNLIKNRVVFHAPITYDDDVDFDLLDIVGMDKNLPIFKFDKPFNKYLFKAFVKAQKSVKFNLVLTNENLIKKSWAKRLENLYFLDEESSSYSLISLINKLNINYISHSAFVPSLNEQFVKVNGEIVNLSFRQFYLHKKAETGGVIYDIKEFILNGKNYILNFSNPHLEGRKIELEINIPLPNGYYHFSKVKTGVKITNLTSKSVGYFNYNARDCQFNFSCVDGLENSTRACINLRLSIDLRAKEARRLYFNYGDRAYLLTNPKQIDDFFDLSQRKAFEQFDVKISSRDKTIDEQLNYVLSQKIWVAWSNFACDEESEKQYLRLKHGFVTSGDRGYYINEQKRGLKEVKIFSNGAFRRVFIVQGDCRYVMADRTRFVNFTQVSKEFFKKTSEIYLCFGK